MTELRGRIRGLGQRPAAARFEEARALLAAAEAALQEWRASYEAPIQALRDDVAALGLGAGPTLRQSLVDETRAIELRIAEHGTAVAQLAEVKQTSADLHLRLDRVNTEIAARESQAGTLATVLAELRDQASEGICPVCGRFAFARGVAV
ncbi:hypothetical protein [Candidatus Poriferisodalis sp.]|uniref:hypothetical protein n=1 Tax=Candidatus Poriferisodalis sp. TaxID=3101277 RepID=UPI003B5C5159